MKPLSSALIAWFVVTSSLAFAQNAAGKLEDKKGANYNEIERGFFFEARGGFNGVKAYEQSKLANVMFALALARRLAGVLTSSAVHPGIVKTNLTREYPELFRQTPPRSVIDWAAFDSTAQVSWVA